MLERTQATSVAARAKRFQLYSLGGVILAVGLYSCLHITARLLASGNLGEDDPLEAILTQTLALGYLPDQPPLYDWVLWLLARMTGPGALHFQILKYSLLTGTCAFIFLSARRVMKGDALWAFFSVEALALIYQISWRFHEGFTHAVGAMCAVAGCFWAFLRLIEGQRGRDYAVLGVAVGLGVLTVTTFWVYLAALLMASALQPAIRHVLFNRGAALTIAVAGLITAPYFIWLAGTPEGVFALLPDANGGSAFTHFARALVGVRRAFTEPVMYLAPLIFLYPIFFPAMIGTVLRTARLRPGAAAAPDYEQLILHMTLLSVAALVFGALLFGVDRYPTHGLMPLFLVTSIWLTAQARRAATSQEQVRRFVIMALGVAAFAFCARAANMYVLEPVCNICRWGVPYASLAAQMKASDFDNGRILVVDRELGGNLRRFFPQAIIALGGNPAYVPQAEPTSAKTALVWSTEDSLDKVTARFRTIAPAVSAETLSHAVTIAIPWRNHFWKPDGYRVSSWHLLVTDEPVIR